MPGEHAPNKLDRCTVSGPRQLNSGLTGVILAGGRSKRMGREKATLVLGKMSILEWVALALRRVCTRLLLVGGGIALASRIRAGVTDDIVPDCGPLGGIVSGLQAADTDTLVVACDMPFLQVSFLRGLVSIAGPSADIVVPLKGGLYEPLLAVYRRSCLEPFKKALQVGERKITSAYRGLRVQEVPEAVWRSWDPLGLSFFNINDEMDLHRAVELLARGEIWPMLQ